MSYYTKITKAGLAAITAAMNNNSKVPITYMAFGDGNGYIPEPDENATSLVNEVYRVGVNKVEVHNKNPNWLVCEAIIPSAVGGFNIREVALYDSTGATMLAIASYPPTYKPTVEEGAAKIQTIRIVIQVDNSGNFELIVDPDVVLATREDLEKINSKIKTVLDYGAKSNKSPLDNFDSTQALKDALDFDWVVYPAATSLAYFPESKNKRVRVPLGRYLITDTLPLSSYLHLDFDDGVVIDFKPTSKIPLFAPPVQKMQDAYATGATTWKDMTLYGMRIAGAALLKGNMTKNSTIHATYAIQASNSHRGLFSRIAIEGFETGLSIDRLDTSEWTGGSRIGNFYENVVDNVSIQDCKLNFFNSGNLTTMINGRIGHETLEKNDPNMGDYLMMNYGAGFTSINLNIASLSRGTNPKKGHIFEACAGSTYHGLYSEYFDNLFIVEPMNRFGGLTIDTGHLVKYPTDCLIKFVDNYMPSYDPVTGLRGGRNLKSNANWIELFSTGIRIMNSNAELLEDFFEFAPQYDFKYGMYGVSYPWNQNIATDFKRWEIKDTGFLSDYGARFIATQKATLSFQCNNQQYDAYVCVLLRDLVGNFKGENIKINAYGSNEFISVAETMYDYGNGWKMYAVRNVKLTTKNKSNLQIDIPQDCQIEIEHIGAYKGGVPIYPTFKDYKPKVNSDNYNYSSQNDVEGGIYRYKYSGGQFGIGDELFTFIPRLPDGSIITSEISSSAYVSTEGSNRQNIKDGNHAAYYGSATVTFSDANTFDSAVTATGNSRNFAESIGVGLYLNVTQGSNSLNDVKVVERVYDASIKRYTTRLKVNKSFSTSTAVVNHRDARKPVFTEIKNKDVAVVQETTVGTIDPNSDIVKLISFDNVKLGDLVAVGFTNYDSGVEISAAVSSNNVVSVKFKNITSGSINLGTGVLNLKRL